MLSGAKRILDYEGPSPSPLRETRPTHALHLSLWPQGESPDTNELRTSIGCHLPLCSPPHISPVFHLKPPTDMKTLVTFAPLTTACPAFVLEVLNYRLSRLKRFPRNYHHSTSVFQTLDAGNNSLSISLMCVFILNLTTSLHFLSLVPH